MYEGMTALISRDILYTRPPRKQFYPADCSRGTNAVYSEYIGLVKIVLMHLQFRPGEGICDG